MKKKILGLLVLFIVIAAFFGGFYFYKIWWPEKQAKIQMGWANPDFPWKDYTEADFKAKYPKLFGDIAPTRVTPEETYAKFREALKTNNLELAVAQMYEEEELRYQEHKAILEKAYKEGKFKEMYEVYPEKIEKDHVYEVLAQYYFVEIIGNEKNIYPIEFTKNSSGDWKMDSL